MNGSESTPSACATSRKPELYPWNQLWQPSSPTAALLLTWRRDRQRLRKRKAQHRFRWNLDLFVSCERASDEAGTRAHESANTRSLTSSSQSSDQCAACCSSA